MTGKKTLMHALTFLIIGTAILCAGWLAAHAGIVPILGLLIAALAPEIFLGGLLVLAVGMVSTLLSNRIAVALLALVLLVFMGINTRLGTVISDIRHGPASAMNVMSRLEVAVGHPIHIQAGAPVISARRYPYASAVPACYLDNCLVTKGFGTPNPSIERDYWHEKVVDVVLAKGFSIAKQGESAPTISIKQETDTYLSTVRIELTGSNGNLLSRYIGMYRNGFPHEMKDGMKSDSPSIAFQYLLHGNFLNGLAARLSPKSEAYPLASFLKHATHLSHPQGQNLGLMSGRPSAGSEPPSVKVALEVLEEKIHDPVLVIREDPHSSISRWSEISWDKARGERCRSLLKPETNGAPQMQTWHLFVNDPSGRKKVRYTGSAVCDPDAIWFLDYVIEKDRTVVTKYSIEGDLIYRASFEKPKEPRGYAGAILMRTFKAEERYLQFDWWNTHQSGRDRHVNRSLKLRFKEPDKYSK